MNYTHGSLENEILNKFDNIGLNSISLDDIVNEIAKAADANEESASFLLDNSFNYDDTYDKLLNEGYISEWIDKANQVNSNNPQLDAQCYVYKSEVQKIITIELKYL